MSDKYKPEMAGSGQTSECDHCGRLPVTSNELGEEHEVYDGCIGKLSGDIMNACCGHGEDSGAYIQFGNGKIIRGDDAINLMQTPEERD